MLRPTARGRLGLALWLAFAAYVVYGGTIPFHFTTSLVGDKLSGLLSNPLVSPDTGRRVSIPDVAQNLLLFAPFGVLGYISLSGRWRTANLRIVVVTAMAATLSLAVETLQRFTLDRTASASDVLANTAGALCGAVTARAARTWPGWPAAEAFAQRLLKARGLYPAVLMVLVVYWNGWRPFDFTLDVSTTADRIRTFAADPWGSLTVPEACVGFALYLLLAVTVSVWLDRGGLRRAPLVTFVAIGSAAAVFEASYFIMESRTPQLSSLAVHGAGALTGSVLAALSRRRSRAGLSTLI